MEHIKNVVLSVLAAMAAACMLAALLFWTWPTQRASAATAQAGDAATLQSAIDNAAEGDVVQLTADITSTAAITVSAGKSVTLDLCGFSIESTDLHAIDNEGSLTVLSTGEMGTIVAKTTAIFNGPNGTGEEIPSELYPAALTVRNVKLEATNTVGAVALNNNCATIESIEGCEIVAPAGTTALSNSGYIKAISDSVLNAPKSTGLFGTAGKAIVLSGNAGTEKGGVIDSVDGCTITGNVQVATVASGKTGAITITDSTITGDIECGDGIIQYSPKEGDYAIGDAAVVAEAGAVVVMDGVGYKTLEEAVAAAPTDNTQVTITFVDGDGDKVIAGNGVVVKAGQNIVFDYNGNTYDIDGTTVGSSGTETNGFQLLKGSTVVMQNGTLTSDKAIILIQKYCDLTLDDMILDGTQTNNYVLSNNNDTTTITGDTQIIAAGSGVAFDVCYWDAYDEVSVVFDEAFTGSVQGVIEYGVYSYTGSAEEWIENTSIAIKGEGSFDVTISMVKYGDADPADANISVSSGTFVKPIAEEYIAEDSLLIPAGDGTYTVEDYESAVGTVTGLIVGNAVYADIAAAEEAGVHVVATIAASESLTYGYTTLIDALRAATAENMVVLADNVTTGGITAGKSFNIDLNEHSIEFTGMFLLNGTDVEGGITVNISNGTIKGTNYGIVAFNNVTLGLTDVNASGSLEGIFVPTSVGETKADKPTTITIEGGIFKGTGENGAGAVICGVGDGVEAPTKLVATGAVFEGTTYGISGNGTAHNTYIELSDCTVKGEVGIYNPQDGELIVNGGSVYGESTGIEIRSGSLTVNGGAEITGAGDPFASDPNGNGTTTTGAAIAVSQHTTNLPIKVTVNDAVLNGVRALFEADLQDEIATDQITITVLGGTFNGEVVSENVTGFVKGGAFTEALDAAYVAADAYFYPTDTGYEASTTAPAAGATTAVAVVNGYYYCKTLAEAVAAAEEGDTVTLHADITTAAMITIDKAVTLDLNGHGVIGGSTNSNFVMEITAGGVTVTNSVSAEEESIVQAGSAEIGALAIRSGLTEEVTIENITILIDDDRTSESGNIVGIQLQSPTLIDNVTIDISASYHLVLGILAADGEATISNSTFTVRGKEGSDAEVHAIHAQAGADIQLIDSAITATGNGTGVVFIGEYANGEEAISAGSSAFPTLTITDSTIVSDSFALAGNGASHGTVIEINNSTLTSELAAAIYHPQYGEMTIVNSNITGTSGIEVRAGIVTVTSGTITATGDPFASDPNGNGSTTDGAAIALVQHTTQLPTEVTVTGGTLNGIRAFYQANLQGNDAAALEKIAINLQGGTYNGEVYSENKTGYITGGQYRDLPAEDAFLEGYAGELFNGYYVVVESGEAGDTADLLAMRLEAQADVRLYAVALGLNWADVSGDADIAEAYAAINTATSESIIALAKAQAMDAVDAYYNTIVDARAEAIEAIEQAAGSDVTVPTATYAAINGAMSAEEIAYYRENALAEIQAIRSLRSEITAQAGELEGIAAAVEKLEGAFAGQGGEFDSLLGDIRAAISAAQEAIESGTSEALQDMQAALEAKIDAGTQAVKDAVSGVMEELTQLAESVAAGDKALQEAIAAGEEALAEQIEAVQGDIDALEGAVGEQASDLQASIDALESAVGEQASAVQADIDALSAAIAAAQADIDDILASIAAGGPSFEELAEQIAAIKSTADGLQTSVGDVQTAVKAAQDAVAAAQGALSGQIEEADDAAAFTTLYVLVGIALALSAAAVALLVVLLLKRSKAE